MHVSRGRLTSASASASATRTTITVSASISATTGTTTNIASTSAITGSARTSARYWALGTWYQALVLALLVLVLVLLPVLATAAKYQTGEVSGRRERLFALYAPRALCGFMQRAHRFAQAAHALQLPR